MAIDYVVTCSRIFPERYYPVKRPPGDLAERRPNEGTQQIMDLMVQGSKAAISVVQEQARVSVSGSTGSPLMDKLLERMVEKWWPTMTASRARIRACRRSTTWPVKRPPGYYPPRGFCYR